MNKKYSMLKSDAGMALLTALIFISITVLVLTAMTARYVQQRLQTDRFEDQYICFEAAEAALEQGKTAINKGNYTFKIGLPDGWEPEFDDGGGIVLPDFDDDGVTPATLTSNPDAQYILYIHQWENDGRDTNGDGLVDNDVEEGVFSVHTAARINGVTRRLEAIYDTRDFGIWNNAIFAGRGQKADRGNNTINGNVKIHGSVHVLGDNLYDGEIAVEGIDMRGAAMILNNYLGVFPEMAARVPAIPKKMYNGEMVETLNTEVRVRKGIVALTGNAHIGDEFVSGAGYKGPVDGTFITDGWGGNAGDRRVYSDNGTDNPYDLGDGYSMPLFEDPWRDPDTGEFVHNPNTGTWYTHAEYFTQVLVGGPDRTSSGGTFNGNVSLGTKDGFYWNATTGEYKTGNATKTVTPNPNDHFILKKANSDIIQVNGAIHINGNLTFPNKADLYYYGRAAVMIEGSVFSNSNLLTTNSPNNKNDYVGSFPFVSCLGLMSRGDMALGEASQRRILGAFYSAQRVSLAMQTQCMGTIVGNDFEMGNQVPDIFQVPVLADNLPLGMIGDYPIVRVRIVSWREIGVG